jgi:hypothetical protein
MADFSEDDKVEQSGNFFPEGIHEVKISSFVFDVTPKNQEFCEIEVFNPANENQVAQTRFWFTTPGGRKYAFNILRGIFVHNAPDDKKDAVREKFNSIKNTTELEKEMKMLIGKDCWLQVYADGTYESNGKMKTNYARDIYGYVPAAKETAAEQDAARGPITVQNEDGTETQVSAF